MTTLQTNNKAVAYADVAVSGGSVETGGEEWHTLSPARSSPNSGAGEGVGVGGYKHVPSRQDLLATATSVSYADGASGDHQYPTSVQPTPGLFTIRSGSNVAVATDPASQVSFTTHRLKNVNGGPYPVTGMHTYTGDPIFRGLNHSTQWQDPYRVTHPVVGTFGRNASLFDTEGEGGENTDGDDGTAGGGPRSRKLPEMDLAQRQSLKYRDAMRHYDTIGATNGAIQYRPNPRYTMKGDRGAGVDDVSIAATRGGSPASSLMSGINNTNSRSLYHQYGGRPTTVGGGGAAANRSSLMRKPRVIYEILEEVADGEQLTDHQQQREILPPPVDPSVLRQRLEQTRQDSAELEERVLQLEAEAFRQNEQQYGGNSIRNTARSSSRGEANGLRISYLPGRSTYVPGPAGGNYGGSLAYQSNARMTASGRAKAAGSMMAPRPPTGAATSSNNSSFQSGSGAHHTHIVHENNSLPVIEKHSCFCNGNRTSHVSHQ